MWQTGARSTVIRGCVSVALAWVALVASASASAPAGFSVVVGSSVTGTSLPPGYVGLALEFSTAPQWFGHGTNTPFDHLLRNINPQGPPVIRFGGASTERSWFPVAGMKRPLGVTYNLGPSWLAAMRALARETDARLLLGVNLEAGSLRISRLEVTQYLNGIGRRYVEAVELGNEPELYRRVPWYRRLGRRILPWYSRTGTPVYARPRGYGAAAWAREYARALKAIPRVPVAGPDSSDPDFLDAFRPFVSTGSQVGMIVSHAYGVNSCTTNPSAPQYPSIPHLLALAASRGLVSRVGPFITLAHRYGASFRIDEMGSVSCNGRVGVSNTMAAALWLMDSLMSLWSSQVDGVNLHTFPHEINNLFDFVLEHGKWIATVHPLYYGALMFTMAAPPGSKQLAVSSSDETQLRAWATLSTQGVLRVLLINDSLNRTASTTVTVPTAFSGSTARLVLLTAAGASATDGLTIGGASFGQHTATGVLPPTASQPVTQTNGAFDVALAPSSAALLTLKPPAGAPGPGASPPAGGTGVGPAGRGR